MYIDNDYNQPPKAFEKLFWTKPTYNDLKEFGFTKKDAKNLIKPNRGGDTKYWIEEFENN